MKRSVYETIYIKITLCNNDADRWIFYDFIDLLVGFLCFLLVFVQNQAGDLETFCHGKFRHMSIYLSIYPSVYISLIYSIDIYLSIYRYHYPTSNSSFVFFKHLIIVVNIYLSIYPFVYISLIYSIDIYLSIYRYHYPTSNSSFVFFKHLIIVVNMIMIDKCEN